MTTSNFDDYEKKLKKIKLDPSRKNLKPDPAHWTFEEQLARAVIEGAQLLEAEEKAKKAAAPPAPSPVLEDALGKMSANPYIRARTQLLLRMTPTARSVIEKMEKGLLDKDHRYDTFVSQIAKLGDKLDDEQNNKKKE